MIASIKSNGRLYARLVVYNSDKRFVEFAANLLGGVRVFPRKKTGLALKPSYVVQFESRHGLEKILPQIIPYLLIKKENGQFILDWYSANPPYDRGKCSRNTWANKSSKQKADWLAAITTGKLRALREGKEETVS